MYYIWESRIQHSGEALIASFAPTARLYGVSFILGRRFSKDIPELVINLDGQSQGKLTDDLVIMKRRCLVHSYRLREVLRSAGVDNIDYYPCVIENLVNRQRLATFQDTARSETHNYYKAANILDMIYCLDRDNSELEIDEEEPSEIWNILNLKLLEDRIGDVLMFRLGEDPSIVIVHHTIKEAVEKANLTGVIFLPADGYRDYQGYAFDNPRNVIGTHDLDPQGPADQVEEELEDNI